MAIIKAPFTEEQVLKLIAWQEGNTMYLEKAPGAFINLPRHPFTCCSHNGCNRLEQVNEGALIPGIQGWICPCGKYTQDWCHDFMVGGPKKVNLMEEGTLGDGIRYGQALKEAFLSKGYTKGPDFNKVFECCANGLTPEETANEIIKNKWWNEN